MPGNEQELETFYVAFYPRLVAALCVPAGERSEAEDAAQEAFARMIRTRRWGSLSTPEAWLYTVGVNILRSRWRKLVRARDRAHLVGDQATNAHGDELSAESLDLREALRDLPSRYRDPLVMFYLLDLPIARIAEETRTSVDTVKSQLSRGRHILADRLAEVTTR